MKSRFLCICFVGLILTVSGEITRAQESGFRFLATGDLPYSEDQDSKYRDLLKQSETEDFAFLMHVGDFKAQSQPCSDDNFTRIRDLFKAYPKPVVYTPGDNEWTDCHGVGADPIERLDKVRELFFNDKQTLRLDKLGVKFQSATPKYSRYVENFRFTKSGVLFVVAHVVGSNNNRRETDEAAMQEYNLRVEANQVFLKDSFAEAVKSQAKAVVVVIHGNPDFETGKKNGFEDFRATMRDFLSNFDRPVVCIHGDTHYYRIDKPFKDKDKKTFMNFTRMEVFGSPNVAGVVVTVDPSDPLVFGFRPYYLSAK
jgi:hypothetical protein